MKKELTYNQIWVVKELERQGHSFIAAVTKREWENGKTYYIDSRVGVKGIRRKFLQGNKEAERK